MVKFTTYTYTHTHHIHIPTKIYSQPNDKDKKILTLYKKWKKDLDRRFTEEDKWMTYKHRNKCLTSLTIKRM